MQNVWKKALGYLGVMLLFLVLAYGFVPQVLGGKIVNQSDISGYVGMSHEAKTWDAEHPDDKTAWTNSMFGGMPTTMLTGNTEGDWTQAIYDTLLTGKRPATYLFISLVGAFLLMLSLGIDILLAIGGAIAVTFCSYNFQIIQVGHNTKMMAIAYLPWVLAAVIYTYRTALGLYKSSNCKSSDGESWKRWLVKVIFGASLFGMALNFQIKANHIQISYYLAIIIACYVIGLFIWLIVNKERCPLVKKFFGASAALLIIGIIGIGTNANKLIPTYEYSQHTMRGGSELTTDSEGNAQKTKGLDIDYATAWSYGWQELPNLMIPNFNGGSSAGAVNPAKSETIKLLKRYGQPNVNEIAKSLPLYWGSQPFTAGPMYMGAITVFLFLLGLFLCEGKDKWWLLAATIVAIFLGVGKNFMPFTRFWYDYMPFYNKFRTVSMALVVLQVTLPMLGFYALDKILKGEYAADKFKKSGLWALALTAGFCLVSKWLAGDFSAASDSSMPKELIGALQADRASLLWNDALVSMFLIIATFVIIWWAYAKPKDTAAGDMHVGSRRTVAAFAIVALVFINMFSVGKRYLNSDHFTTPRDFNGQFAKRPVDETILADPALSYRVLDLTVNVFNDSHPSYWHKNIGGYSPVKMQRYQDLIDRHLNREINTLASKINGADSMEALLEDYPYLPVLSMLNDKYVILGANGALLENPYACGNAWFVEDAWKADTPNQEIDMLGAEDVDLNEIAIIGPDFAWAHDKISGLAYRDSWEDDTIALTSYAPNELRYHYEASTDRAVVFSEIYYPDGWTLKLADGKDSATEGSEIELFRADWTLRGAIVPAGSHDLVMRFEPQSYVVSSSISRTSSILLILLILGSACGQFCAGKACAGLAKKKEA